MATLRRWWDDDAERAQNYDNTMLDYDGVAPHPLSEYMAQDIIGRHLRCPSLLCILSIQDWMAMDEEVRLPDANAERINIPANPKHYWRYRMHVNIEDLQHNDVFNNLIEDMITRSGR
jgi:4-alpha-glucanotransferase